MQELTRYGVTGWAAMLIVAFGLTSVAELQPARGKSSFDLINCRGNCHTNPRISMVALYAVSIGVAWLVNSAREREAGRLICTSELPL